MPTSPTEGARPALLEHGEEGALLRTLVVPGSEVAIHWLALAPGLTEPQAAAAARLLLEGASAAPLADLHVAVGRAERGLTPVALAPAARMAEWVADDPDIVLPSPFLLLPPDEGLVRHGIDHRGPAQAFSLEPELAALVAGEAAVRELGEADYEAGLAPALTAPALNLRQGPFARRRQWALDRGRLRRIALLALALVAASLILQLATIMRYSFAADRLEAEAAALGGGGAERRAGFAPLAAILFDSVRAIPNVELTRIDYRPDGSLSAIVQVDNPATLAILRRHVEASGAAVEAGSLEGAGPRPAAELVLRGS